MGPAAVFFLPAVCFTFLTPFFSHLGAMVVEKGAELASCSEEVDDEV